MVERTCAKPISKHSDRHLFEDINYAADGGLYCRVVQNRDFRVFVQIRFSSRLDAVAYAWAVKKGNASAAVTIAHCLPHPIPTILIYAVLEARPGVTLQNDGFDGY